MKEKHKKRFQHKRDRPKEMNSAGPSKPNPPFITLARRPNHHHLPYQPMFANIYQSSLILRDAGEFAEVAVDEGACLDDCLGEAHENNREARSETLDFEWILS